MSDDWVVDSTPVECARSREAVKRSELAGAKASVNDTFKGQLDPERHGGRTVDGVTVRVLQRVLALVAAIWHNDVTGQPVMRSLAYDH